MTAVPAPPELLRRLAQAIAASAANNGLPLNIDALIAAWPEDDQTDVRDMCPTTTLVTFDWYGSDLNWFELLSLPDPAHFVCLPSLPDIGQAWTITHEMATVDRVAVSAAVKDLLTAGNPTGGLATRVEITSTELVARESVRDGLIAGCDGAAKYGWGEFLDALEGSAIDRVAALRRSFAPSPFTLGGENISEEDKRWLVDQYLSLA